MKKRMLTISLLALTLMGADDSIVSATTVWYNTTGIVGKCL